MLVQFIMLDKLKIGEPAYLMINYCFYPPVRILPDGEIEFEKRKMACFVSVSGNERK